MLDIHILTVPERADWLEQCLDSLKGSPCTVHVVREKTGTVAEMRAEAFRLGSEPYVGYVDDDDLVEPGAVSALIDALNNNPQAVGAYTDEVLVNERNEILRPGFFTGRDWSPVRHLGNPQAVHHLWIGRRDLVEKHLDDVKHMPIAMGWALTALMAQYGPWLHVPIVGYRWRQHGKSYHSNGQWNSPAVREMARMITEKWKATGILLTESQEQ